jgi:uncharacterized membrane protein YvbJ
MSSQPSQSTESITSSWMCSACGFANKEGSKFCGQCGASLVEYCPQCGGEIPSSASSCEHCGTDCERILASGERCQQCGLQNDAQAEFCTQCGARLLIECPECGAMTRARLSFCAHCGFDYSQFVTQKVIEKFDRKEEGKKSVYAKGLSAGIMIALVTISIVIIIYILHQT